MLIPTAYRALTSSANLQIVWSIYICHSGKPVADLYFNSISMTSGQRKGDNEIYMQWYPG